MKLAHVHGNQHLRRDIDTNAVVNVDEQSYQTYINIRSNAVKVKMLEKDVNDLKILLTQLLESKNG